LHCTSSKVLSLCENQQSHDRMHRGAWMFMYMPVLLVYCFDECCSGCVKTERDTKGSRPVVYECTNAKEYGRCSPETLSVLGYAACS